MTSKHCNKFLIECPYQGPRQFEVPYAINNLIDGPTLEIGAHDSLFKWILIRRGWPFTLLDPLDPSFMQGSNHRLATCINKDIRKTTPQEIGTFSNVLLISVLEHISLSAYKQKKDWEISPAQSQKEAFDHCIKFVKPGGRMIVTLPYGNETNTNPDFKLIYDIDMLHNLQKEYKLVDQKFFTRCEPIWLDRWEEISAKEKPKRSANVCFIVEYP